MKNPAVFESFIRGIPRDMPPFEIVRISKLSDTQFDIFVNIKFENRAPTDLPESEDADAEEKEYDLRILIGYLPQAAVLSMGVWIETAIPLSAHGWALACLNSLNMIGNGRVSKVFLPDPDPEEDEALTLVVGWEVGLYDPSILEGEGLKFLTALIYSIMLRLCVEASNVCVQLTQVFYAEFPAGKLNS